jgi:hypothetical protein
VRTDEKLTAFNEIRICDSQRDCGTWLLTKLVLATQLSPQSSQAEQTETEQGKAEPVGCTDEGAKTEVAMLLKRDR